MVGMDGRDDRGGGTSAREWANIGVGIQSCGVESAALEVFDRGGDGVAGKEES